MIPRVTDGIQSARIWSVRAGETGLLGLSGVVGVGADRRGGPIRGTRKRLAPVVGRGCLSHSLVGNNETGPGLVDRPLAMVGGP